MAHLGGRSYADHGSGRRFTMKLSRAGYALGFVTPTIAILGYLLQAPWLFIGIAVVWVVVLQCLDEVCGRDAARPWSALRAELTPPDGRFPVENVALYAYVLLH